MKTNILNISLILAAVLLISQMPAMCLDLNFSANEGGLKLITENDVGEQFGRGLPMGPASVRFLGSDLWVADSLAGKFMSYDRSGKLVQSLAVENGEKYIFADFAFQLGNDSSLEFIWAIGSEETHLLKIAPNGKIVAEFATNLIRPEQIEVVGGRYLVVYDHGYANIVAYDLTGKELWHEPAAAARFAVTATNELVFIRHENEAVKVCKMNLETGKTTVLCGFPISLEAEPRLLLLKDEQNLLFSFHMMSEESNEAMYQIGQLSLTDARLNTVDSAFPAAFLNRFLVEKGNLTFIVSFVESEKERLLRVVEFVADFSERQSEG